MSMFYELMMKNKTEEEIYAQVFGTPTENPSGVFSGFSNANYLLIEKQLPEDTTEIQIEFTMPSTFPNTQKVIINAGVFSFSLYQQQITLYGGSGTRVVIPSNDLTVGSNYVIRAPKSNKTFNFSYSKDGGAFTTPTTWTSGSAYSSTIRFGNSTVNGRAFTGSINFNNTYFKRGNKFWYRGATKW